MERRNFIKTAGAVAAGVSLAGNLAYANSVKTVANKLPKWKEEIFYKQLHIAHWQLAL